MRLERLQPIGEQLTEIVRLMLGDMELHSPVLRLERSRTQSWGYRDELCDVGELARRLKAGAASEVVAVAAGELDAGVRGAVVAQSKSVRDEGVSGVGVFFPASWEPIPSHYAQTYEFAQHTGWGEVLAEHYRVSGRGLIR
jgi:hypothetical protein